MKKNPTPALYWLLCVVLSFFCSVEITAQETVTKFFGTAYESPNGHAGTILRFSETNDTYVTPIYTFENSEMGPTYNSVIKASDGLLYGHASYGGASNYGGIFSVRPDGFNFKVLHNFTLAEGIHSFAPLLQAADGKLYGLTMDDGVHTAGTLFNMNLDGSGFTILHRFEQAKGIGPRGALAQAPDGMLYGAASSGGTFERGVIFRVKTDGSNYTVLHHFDDVNGAFPSGGVLLGQDGALYGVTGNAIFTNSGTVFKINTDGTGFTLLHVFPYNSNSSRRATPICTLVQSADGTLYGNTLQDGTNFRGTLFKLNPDGTGFSVLHNFNYTDGSYLTGTLTLHNNKLYGFTHFGGANDGGVIFRYDLGDNSFHKLADLSDATGKGPWMGALAPVVLPKTIDGLYVTLPKANAVDVSANPKVTVTEIAGAQTYTMQVSTDPDFTPATTRSESGGRTVNFSGLSVSTTYYVRAKTNLSSYWSESQKFTTGSAQKQAFVVSPGNNTTNNSWEPLVELNPVPGATMYIVQLSNYPMFRDQVYTKRGNTTKFQYTGLTKRTTYYSRVTTDAAPNQWGPVRSFVTGDESTLAYLRNPPDNGTGVTTNIATLVMNIVPHAAEYRIELSERADFHSIEFTIIDSSNVVTVSGLKYSTTYYNRVITDVSYDYGAIRTFTTRSAASLARVIFPGNNTENVAAPTVNVGSSNVPGASTYTIQLSESADFSTIALEKTGSSSTQSFSGLNYGTIYYNRVRTDLTADFGQTGKFKTRLAPTIARAAVGNVFADEETSGGAIEIYPNPFHNRIVIRVNSAVDTKAEISMINMMGTKLHQSTAPTNEDVVLENNFSAGIYFVRIRSVGIDKLIRVVKIE